MKRYGAEPKAVPVPGVARKRKMTRQSHRKRQESAAGIIAKGLFLTGHSGCVSNRATGFLPDSSLCGIGVDFLCVKSKKIPRDFWPRLFIPG